MKTTTREHVGRYQSETAQDVKNAYTTAFQENLQPELEQKREIIRIDTVDS